MKNVCTVLIACTLAVGLSACSDSLSIVAPELARFDGGFTVGGGHRIGADSSSSASSPSTESPADSRFDGGYTIGSGGRAGGASGADSAAVAISSAEAATEDAPAERGEAQPSVREGERLGIPQ